MGTVYEAEQDSPRRRVALKMIRSGVISPDVLRRFRSETEILGRLEHPGIGRIFAAGTFEGQPYFAMEFIEGHTLLEHARAARPRRLGPAPSDGKRVRCGPLSPTSTRVIHRDLKPDNVLVQELDGGPQPKILDFGIARVTDTDVGLTLAQTAVGQLVGTLQYMSRSRRRGGPTCSTRAATSTRSA